MSTRGYFEGKTVLITGASSGIGAQIARQLANVAGHLVLVARREDRLVSLKREIEADSKTKVSVFSCDLSDRSAAEHMMEQVEAGVGAVDVLVNNAGFGDVSKFWKADLSKLERMIDVNIRAPVLLAHRFLPGMIERGFGGVLNVSSGFGLVWMARFATYVGTKHFVTGWTESLASELKDSGVHVSQLCPGPVRTEFIDVAQERDTEEIPQWAVISAKYCARKGLNGLAENQALVVPGPHMQAAMAAASLVPRGILRSLMRQVD